jgi:hypothetical protein
MRRKRDQDFYAEREVRTKVLPEVKSHTPPITKGNSPGEGKKKKENDFCLMKREKKKFNFQNSIQKDRYVGPDKEELLSDEGEKKKIQNSIQKDRKRHDSIDASVDRNHIDKKSYLDNPRYDFLSTLCKGIIFISNLGS